MEIFFRAPITFESYHFQSGYDPEGLSTTIKLWKMIQRVQKFGMDFSQKSKKSNISKFSTLRREQKYPTFKIKIHN